MPTSFVPEVKLPRSLARPSAVPTVAIFSIALVAGLIGGSAAGIVGAGMAFFYTMLLVGGLYSGFTWMFGWSKAAMGDLLTLSFWIHD